MFLSAQKEMKMQGLINSTFEQLNKKNKENSILQNEILKLKRQKKCNRNKFNKKQCININYMNKRKQFNSRYDNSEECMDNKWDEIRQLNRKMDNLLRKNENNLEKYEKMRQQYNEKFD